MLGWKYVNKATSYIIEIDFRGGSWILMNVYSFIIPPKNIQSGETAREPLLAALIFAWCFYNFLGVKIEFSAMGTFFTASKIKQTFKPQN